MKLTDLAGGAAGLGMWAAQSLVRGPQPLPPIVSQAGKRAEHVAHTETYGRGQKLDIWRPANPVNAPVFFFIPGGAWVIGKRRPQGYALMSHLVEQGWICVAIDYRTAPLHRWPTPYYDVKRAYQWVRENIGQFGGNPDFVIVGGASAGGHMAALAGLQWRLDPPQAVVGIYGAYDWESRRSPFHRAFMQFLETVVVGQRQVDNPTLFTYSSPMAQVHSDAPPFLLVHGTKDRLCPVADARRFRNALAVCSAKVTLHEISGGVHAFDLVNPRQAADMVTAISEFIFHVYVSHILEKAS